MKYFNILLLLSCLFLFANESAAQCAKPSGIGTSMSPPNVTISCSSVSGATKYLFRYRMVGSSTWSKANRNSPSVSLTLPNGAYEWRVRAKCGPEEKSKFTSKQSFSFFFGRPTQLKSEEELSRPQYMY